MNNIRQIWYFKHFVNYLNKKGYVHFISKEQCTDFKAGRAFFFDFKAKEYGYLDVICSNHINKCNRRTKLIKEKIKCLIQKKN